MWRKLAVLFAIGILAPTSADAQMFGRGYSYYGVYRFPSVFPPFGTYSNAALYQGANTRGNQSVGWISSPEAIYGPTGNVIGSYNPNTGIVQMSQVPPPVQLRQSRQDVIPRQRAEEQRRLQQQQTPPPEASPSPVPNPPTKLRQGPQETPRRQGRIA